MKPDENYEILAHIGKAFSEKAQSWLPCIRVLENHDHHPAWTAALMYLVLDRYVSSINDKYQEAYIKETLKNFEGMLELGPNYLESFESADDLE